MRFSDILFYLNGYAHYHIPIKHKKWIFKKIYLAVFILSLLVGFFIMYTRTFERRYMQVISQTYLI